MPKKLTADERTGALSKLPAWTLVDGRDAICRELSFGDFSEAWGFMSRVALKAEQMNHHPSGSTSGRRCASRCRPTTAVGCLPTTSS